MTNTITVEFDPCEPTPANGYKISYRILGSVGAYRTPPGNFFASPAVIVDTLDPSGTSYEGIIQGDCGGGKLGVPVPFVAEFVGSVVAPSSEAPSSPSAPSSAPSSEPPPNTGTIIIQVNMGIDLESLSGITHDVAMPINGATDGGVWTGFTGGAMAITVTSPGGGSWSVSYNGVFQNSETFPAGTSVGSGIAGLAAPANGVTIEILVSI